MPLFRNLLAIRFTPRRQRSIWSKVNVMRAGELIATGRMQPAGIKAFEARQQERSGVYSFEQSDIAFDKSQEQQFKREKVAWQFFQSQAPWYRRTATYWVISAKRNETKAKRLKILIEDSAAGRTIRPLTRRKPDATQPAQSRDKRKRTAPSRNLSQLGGRSFAD